jgi:hypothetical protein
MHHQPGHMFVGLHLPELLHADAVDLRRLAFAQLEALLQRLAEVAAAAFREDGVLRVQLHAGLEARGLLALLADAHVAGGHAQDLGAATAPRIVVEHLGGREAGIDLDSGGLGLRAQPAADVAEAHDVVAVVGEARGQRPLGHLERAALREEEEAVLGHGLVQRGALFLPVGEELGERAWIHDGAGEDVGSDFGAFLDHADREVLAFFRAELLQAYRRGQARRACADDDYVVLH